MAGTNGTFPRFLRPIFLIVDLGFIAYWAVTLAGVIPAEYLFKDYDDPILQAWNWSFLPLDLGISATGLVALRRARTGRAWRSLAIVSLVLTSCSGLMAVSFWTLRQDFDPAWWAPNLFLLLYPLVYLAGLAREP
jgi:hypothetical protein